MNAYDNIKISSYFVSLFRQELKGGFVNQSWICSHDDEKLVFRVNRDTDRLSFVSRDYEALVIEHLDSKGLVPKYYGRFKNGLVYEYAKGKLSVIRIIVQTGSPSFYYLLFILIIKLYINLKSKTALEYSSIIHHQLGQLFPCSIVMFLFFSYQSWLSGGAYRTPRLSTRVHALCSTNSYKAG